MALWVASLHATPLNTPEGPLASAPKILIVGDSLSAEYGLPRGSGWVALLEQRLRKENKKMQVINASISGETTSGGRNRIKSLLQQHQPQVVVIELGANDALRGLPLDATQANLKAMIQTCQQAHSRVLLIGMQVPPNYGKSYNERFLQTYRDLSKDQKTALVPFMLQGIAEHLDLFQADRIHPKAEAHTTILDTIWPQLKPLLAP